MPDPTSDDARRIVDKIYMATFDDRLWDPAIEDLLSLFGASGASLGFYDLEDGSALALRSDMAPEYDRLFMNLGHRNPILSIMARQAVGATSTEAQFVDRTEFERGAFFNEWARPQGYGTSLFTRLTAGGGPQGQLALLRDIGRPGFDHADLAFLDRIAPDLIRVASLRSRAGQRELSRRFDAFELAATGALAIDRHGRLLAANQLGQQMLEEGRGLLVRRGHVAVSEASDRERFHVLIADATYPFSSPSARGGDTVIAVPDTGLPGYGLSIRPIPDGPALGLPAARAALVLIRGIGLALPSGLGDRLAAMFGFSPREAELAVALASGKTLQQAAEGRGITLPTARTQLSQLFRKTGTTRQSELVALLLGILPLA